MDLSPVGFIVVGFIVSIVAIIAAPALCLQGAAADSETQDESDERDSPEDAKCQSFSLGLNLSC